MLLTVYDPLTFERKGTVPKIKSLSWNKRFYEIGSFQLEAQNINLQRNDILLHGDNCGIVMETQKAIPSGVIVYGYDLKGLTEFRYIEKLITYENKTAEYIMKDLAALFFTVGDRAISGFQIDEDTGEGEIIESYTVEMGFLSEQLEKISKTYDIGYDIEFDEQRILFKTRYAVDNPNVTFSRRHHNLEDVIYTQSNYNTYNVAYAMDEEENVILKGNATGILRREGYTDKSTELDAFLSEKKEIENIEGTAGSNVVLGLDYRLGDYVKVIFDDLQTTKVISEVNLQYERTATKVFPVFGTEKPNPIKKILRG